MPTEKASQFDVAVIGDWHNAHITAACLAKLGHRVVLVNPTPEKPWTSYPALALHEPGLPELVAEGTAEGRLHHANDYAWTAEFTWLASDTPIDENDRPHTETLTAVAEQMKGRPGIFIVGSQVPLGFCANVEREYGLTAACVPENLHLGRGVDTFMSGDRIVIGATTAETVARVRALFKGLPGTIIECDLHTAEMIKHATNAFLATSVSLANEIAAVGEPFGVDGAIVGQALKLDSRIGKKAYVMPGTAFAGGTLARDLRALQALGKERGRVTPLVDAVLEANALATWSLFDAVARCVDVAKGCVNGLNGHVLLLGYTYKAGTDTLRRSPTVQLADRLRTQGARVTGYDPLLSSGMRTWDEVRAGERVDVAVVMTARPEFKKLAWAEIARLGEGGRKPVVLDTCNGVVRDDVIAAGFVYKAMWRPMVTR